MISFLFWKADSEFEDAPEEESSGSAPERRLAGAEDRYGRGGKLALRGDREEGHCAVRRSCFWKIDSQCFRFVP